jgi:hypothetical protein
MSPVQNASERLDPCPNGSVGGGDPEKRSSSSRRTSGTRLIPAVNALASSSTHDALFDPFRSPPPPQHAGLAASKAHLRSPSGRLQAALNCSTPGGTRGRMPMGWSPSLALSGSAWAEERVEYWPGTPAW